MIKLVRFVVAMMALLLGISGMLFGFRLWLYPGNTAMHSPELILSIIARGLIAWWLGCRLAIPAPRPVRLDQAGAHPHFMTRIPERRRYPHAIHLQIVQAGPQVAAEKNDVLGPLAVALDHELPNLAEPRD